MGKGTVAIVAISLAGGLLLSATPARTETSQDILTHYVNLDVASKRSEVMTKAVLMNEAERRVFWPVYDAYQRELVRSSRERDALLKEYVKDAGNLDDARANVLMVRAFDLQEKRVALLKKYAEELQKQLPGKLVLKFVQVELQLQHLTDLQVAGQLPDIR